MIQEESKRQRYRRKVIYARKLRQRMTKPEMILWKALRDRKCVGIKFRRQVPMGWFVVDFLCREYRLIIEIDGKIHEKTLEYDRARDTEIRLHNYRVLRFSNIQILKNLEDVLRTITAATQHSSLQSHSPSPVGEREGMGEGVRR
ncbi:MAG: endonuclease domain-containing protein [Candidatus Peribacteraceae bacterium]|nr:endonuclease domain-containing protein [Candidatus Peribacteraceae bacterium]